MYFTFCRVLYGAVLQHVQNIRMGTGPPQVRHGR